MTPNPPTHLFGLVRSAHLNGCSCRLLDEESADDRLAVEVTLFNGRLRRVLARPANVGKRASEEDVASVLSSEDLATHIVHLSGLDEILRSMGTQVDGAWRPPSPQAHSAPDLTPLAALATVNRAFSRAVLADALWKHICAVRWMCKWGFQARLSRARSSGWRAAYVAEERDATRQSITSAELHALRFDFRFWLFAGGFDGEYDSGLRQSQSQDVRLVPGDGGGPAPPSAVVAQGRMLGHPNSRASEEPIAWFLDADGRGVQWGYLPHLWPKGIVRRLPSWGWEIVNPNARQHGRTVVCPAARIGAGASARRGWRPRAALLGRGGLPAPRGSQLQAVGLPHRPKARLVSTCRSASGLSTWTAARASSPSSRTRTLCEAAWPNHRRRSAVAWHPRRLRCSSGGSWPPRILGRSARAARTPAEA